MTGDDYADVDEWIGALVKRARARRRNDHLWDSTARQFKHIENVYLPGDDPAERERDE